ncbi:hypothetical protein pipiens_010579 [Culex pipiens pipiens]|uniref:Large ribosomal subunit protein uL24m n=1 Tax=Culex pipiens pipiens TaxID=38569 RepID=A0ABD1D9M0_CULPP
MRLTGILQKIGDASKKFSNLPDAYIKRSMEQVYWKTPRGKPQYLPRTVERKKFRFTTNRPWTGQFRQQNMPGTIRKKVFVEPVANWTFFKGDRVEVLAGKDKGKQGIVSQVFQERNWVIVAGLNCHLRKVADEKDYPGITIRSEAPLLVTHQDGEKVRVSTRTGRIIPIPKGNEETHDYKSKSLYVERPKDTPGDVVKEITFKPSLQTFEMEVMQEMGIEEDRTPRKTFWY